MFHSNPTVDLSTTKQSKLSDNPIFVPKISAPSLFITFLTRLVLHIRLCLIVVSFNSIKIFRSFDERFVLFYHGFSLFGWNPGFPLVFLSHDYKNRFLLRYLLRSGYIVQIRF